MPAINGAVHVEIMRRGGIAGVALRGSFETSDLSPSARDEIDQALRGLPFGAPAAEPRHPDGFRYEIVVRDESGSRSAELDEAQVPRELRPTLDSVLGLPDPPAR